MRMWQSKEVPGNPAVGVGVATYLNDDPRRLAALSCLIASFQAQTYHNWKMNLVHDGPTRGAEAQAVLHHPEVRDKRIISYEMTWRRQQFGHPWRQFALDDLLAQGCEWLLLTNDDNYYAPTFLEWLLFTALHTPFPGCALVYCDCVHSHRHWKPMQTELRRGKIDLGCVLVRSDLARRVPFDDHEFAGDWTWISRLAALCPGRTQKVPAALFCHN